MAKSGTELKVRLAAYLRGHERLSEADIAFRLGGVMPSTVSGLLKKAKQSGLLEEQIVYKGNIDPPRELEDALYTLTFQSELRSRIEQQLTARGCTHAPRIYLYDLGADGGADVPILSRVRAFAARAAPELRRLLTRPSVTTIGVAWGETLAAMIDAFGLTEKRAPRAKHPVTVIALCGEPLDDRPTSESSSALAEKMSVDLNGTREHARTLGITPAYLPAKTNGNGVELIWHYIVNTKPYLEVFGPGRLPTGIVPRDLPATPPLCEKMDAYLTGVSIQGSTLGYGKHKIYRADFVDPAEIENVVFGDMGGIPLPRPNLTPEQNKVLQSIEDSWTGLTRQQLLNCVARGFEGRQTSRPPGCILVAVGALKARTVYQAVVTEGLVNHLFIDYECAQALAGLLANPSGDEV